MNPAVQEFIEEAHASCDREVVGLLGLRAAHLGGHFYLPLENIDGKHGFQVDDVDWQAAIEVSVEVGAHRLILCHSHLRGTHRPSRKDVLGIGQADQVDALNGLMQGYGVEPPMLHLIYSVERDEWAIYQIDERIGPIVRRRGPKNTTAIRPRGWVEIPREEVFY